MTAVTLLLALALAPGGALPSRGAAGPAPHHPSPPPTQAAAAADPFRVDTVLRPPGGPRIVLLAGRAPGLAALRIFVPLAEGPAEAGAGRLLEALARSRMEGLARPAGARVTASRTPLGLAYSVEGAAADFEYLAYLIRRAVAWRDPAPGLFRRLRSELRHQVARSWETPAGRLSEALRHAFTDPGGWGPTPRVTLSAVDALDVARVRDVWRRSHQATGMTLVVSGDIPPEVVLAAASRLGAPEEYAAPPLDAPALPASPPPPVETLRTWFGLAYPAGSPEDPRGPVAAALVSDLLRERAKGFEASVRLWETREGSVLAVLGAAYPDAAPDMRRTLSGVVAHAARSLDEPDVTAAVTAVRREILLRARTPLGLVTQVGRTLERTDDTAAASRYLAALGGLTRDDLRAFLEALAASEPTAAEIRP